MDFAREQVCCYSYFTMFIYIGMMIVILIVQQNQICLDYLILLLNYFVMYKDSVNSQSV